MSNPIVDATSAPNEQDLVYGGEAIPSIRKLLKRHCHSWSHSFVAVPNGLFKTGITQSLYPFGPTYVNSVANNLFNTATLDRVNYASHTFVGWFSPAFAARRGSMYWAVSQPPPEGQSGCISSIVRTPVSSALSSGTMFITSNLGNTSSLVAAGAVTDPAMRFGNGAFLTNTQTQAGVAALIPFYSNHKFVGTHPRSYTRSYNNSNAWTYSVNSAFKQDSSDSDVEDFYCAAGPDFGLHFFVGIPTLRSAAVPPA
jgi:hypothetical protein